MTRWSYRVRTASSPGSLQLQIKPLARDGWELDKLTAVEDHSYAVMRRERRPEDEEQEKADEQRAAEAQGYTTS